MVLTICRDEIYLPPDAVYLQEVCPMRGEDTQQNAMFSYLSPEQRVPQDHPVRRLRRLVDAVLSKLSRRFTAMYAHGGRPSIPPEKLLRARLAAAGALHHPQRAPADGGVGLQLAVPVVCGLEHGRSGLGRHGVLQEPGAVAEG